MISYCTRDEINDMFGDISDDITEEMFNTVIKNSAVWINSNLKKNYVPLPTKNVDTLKTIAIYYAASDILLSLYHGEEMPVQYDIWFQKAQSLLNDYIDAYLNSEAQQEDLIRHQSVKHSHGLTYAQKRGRRRRGIL